MDDFFLFESEWWVGGRRRKLMLFARSRVDALTVGALTVHVFERAERVPGDRD